MPGFSAIIVLAFIWGVKLFDYVVDGGKEGGDIADKMGDMASRWGGSNPQDAMPNLLWQEWIQAKQAD